MINPVTSIIADASKARAFVFVLASPNIISQPSFNLLFSLAYSLNRFHVPKQIMHHS